MADEDPFSQLTWLEADQSPFGMRVLDCRPFTTTMMSMTKDEAIAAKFSELRTSNGEEHRGKSPENAATVRCDLRYPVNGTPHDGPLFQAQQMEDKWDIYLHDSHLYFARSWTGDLVFRAAITFQDGEAIVSEVQANRGKVMNDSDLAVRMVDFLAKSHLCRCEAPHPLLRSLPDDKRSLALWSFSEYGRRAFFGSFEDTTKVRVPRER